MLDDLLENGQGVGRVDGLVAFVSGGLPGERVSIAVDSLKRNYATAHVARIEKPSPDRVAPNCPVFGRCGGCQTLHYRREAELNWKRRLVADAMARIGGLGDCHVDPVISAQHDATDGYRNKVSLVARFIGGRARLGFFEARSHRIVPIERCPVAIPPLSAAIEALVGVAESSPDVFRDVRHVVARASSTCGDLVISFNGQRPNAALHRHADDLRRRIPGLTGLLANWEPSGENVIFGRRSAVLWGSPNTREEVGAAILSAGITSFFQINTPILQLLSQRVIEMLQEAVRVVDLYCGIGTFGVLLGKRGVASTGVESFKTSVDDATANAAENGVACAAFECADVAAALAGERGNALLLGANAVVLDPPRKGCDAEVLSSLARMHPERIAYVSCNPATLARDAIALFEVGYRVVNLSPLDIFTVTGHV
ncbi:MAG: 23S rRNA (uracil(1939)-C(5))-methyltransferase RlmD, partial [Candidatus Eremiobacteraeota bacterium]|nr:23S rRNA (uracil(1939)-C(5))-methyltransferase RlmD [Candidatus Eremiobacteraeota bacterium]